MVSDALLLNPKTRGEDKRDSLPLGKPRRGR